MIVCLCEGLSDRVLRRHVADGCRSVRDLTSATGAGAHCGACACDLRRLVQEGGQDHAGVPSSPASARVLRR